MSSRYSGLPRKGRESYKSREAKPFEFNRKPEGDKVRGQRGSSTKVSKKAAQEKPFLSFIR